MYHRPLTVFSLEVYFFDPNRYLFNASSWLFYRLKALDNSIVPVIILAMKTFVDDKKIQSNACGIIWVIAKDMKVRVEKGEIDEVISLIKKATELQHFQNLEIGQRNPYRFKIVVPGRALHRLEE